MTLDEMSRIMNALFDGRAANALTENGSP